MDSRMEDQLNSSINAFASPAPGPFISAVNERSTLPAVNETDSRENTNDKKYNSGLSPTMSSISISDSEDEDELLIKVDTENVPNNYQNYELGATSDLMQHEKHIIASESDPKTTPLRIPYGFKCQFCPFKSKHRRCVVAHVMIHTGKMPFQCDICSHKSRRKDSLRKHMLKHKNVVRSHLSSNRKNKLFI